MGGYGSGRLRSRQWLSELLKLSLATFRQCELGPEQEWTGRSYCWHAGGTEIGSVSVSKDREGLRLSYAPRDGDPTTQHIGLRYFPRHFGGSLVVAVCPGCWRQVRVLYFRRAFYCNRCTVAVYASSSQTKARRALVQFQRLGERIRQGTHDAGLYYFPRRPKRMRPATYERLRERASAQLNRYHSILDAGLLRAFARVAPSDLVALLGDDAAAAS